MSAATGADKDGPHSCLIEITGDGGGVVSIASGSLHKGGTTSVPMGAEKHSRCFIS